MCTFQDKKKIQLEKQQRGRFTGTYDIFLDRYTSTDFSKKCILFQGQGGVFDSNIAARLHTLPAVQEALSTADTLAVRHNQEKISSYKGTSEKVSVLRNLYLFTLYTGLYREIIRNDIVPELISAHSFGEYAALCASGILSFEDTFSVLLKREELCLKHQPTGTLIAIIAGENKIQRLLSSTNYSISNKNSPGQTVISVPIDEIKQTVSLLKQSRTAYKALNIPQPFHSSLMQPVADELNTWLETQPVQFHSPRIPLYSSVLKNFITKENCQESDLISIIANQIIEPVDFITQIQDIHSAGVYSFIEIGPKRVLTNFIADTLRNSEIKKFFVSDLLDIEVRSPEKKTKRTNRNLFNTISKAISRITGYEIEKISIEDRYQEDLGIDSLKKTEILVEVIKETGTIADNEFSLFTLQSIENTIDYIEESRKNQKTKVKNKKSSAAVFKRYHYRWAPTPLAPYTDVIPTAPVETIFCSIEEILDNSEKAFQKLTTAQNGMGRSNIIIVSEDRGFDIVETSAINFYGSIENRLLPLVHFFQEIIQKKELDCNLVFLTRENTPLNAGMNSFFKSLTKEIYSLFYKHIQITDDTDRDNLLHCIHTELSDPIHSDILYEKGVRHTRAVEVLPDETPKRIADEDVFIVLGGAKGITYSLLRSLSKRNKPIIYILGRSSIEDSTVSSNLGGLLSENAKVFYYHMDASDFDALQKLFDNVYTQQGRIDYVINGTGVLSINLLKNKTKEEIQYEIQNKVPPLFYVLKLSQKYKVRRVVNFSSIISETGNPGQSIYTLSNNVTSALASFYNSSADTSSARTIHWPPWEYTGMTALKGVSEGLNQAGLSLLDSNHAFKLFQHDLVAEGDIDAVFYLDENNNRQYEFLLRDLARYKNLIGIIKEPFNIKAEKIPFAKTFDIAGPDKYLKEHAINNIPYVPAAQALAMFLAASRLLSTHFPIISDFTVHNPLIIKNRMDTELELCPMKEEIQISLKSRISHFSCKATLKTDYSSPVVPKRGKYTREIIARSLYSKFYSRNGLYHGPLFQNLHKGFLDEKDNLTLELENQKVGIFLQTDIYDKLIAWIDAGIQALSLKGILAFNCKCIPMSVQSLRLQIEKYAITERLYITPEMKSFDKNTLTGDVLISNEHREVLIQMKDLSMQKLNQYDKSKMEIIDI